MDDQMNEAEAAAEEFATGPQGSHKDSWTYQMLRDGFLAGVAWVQSKPAPSEWEGIRVEAVNNHLTTEGCTPGAVMEGFSVAIDRIAKPLLAENSRLRSENEQLRARVKELEENLDKAAATIECKDREISQFRQERFTLRAQLADLEKELKEQARLNGMGSEREARLQAKLAEREREVKVATERAMLMGEAKAYRLSGMSGAAEECERALAKLGEGERDEL